MWRMSWKYFYKKMITITEDEQLITVRVYLKYKTVNSAVVNVKILSNKQLSQQEKFQEGAFVFVCMKNKYTSVA